MAIISLTTDFGTTDWFVGSMKGVILSINPQVQIVDITHAIPAGDIRAGAFALAASCRSFPRLTVHCAVVDPGVGSQRAAIVVRTADYFFVGPDNGLLSLALAKEDVRQVWRVTNPVLFREPVSNTFHGRDVFAPVAARITQGVFPETLGEPLAEYEALAWPVAKLFSGIGQGEIVYIDRFGNCITNLPPITNPNLRVYLSAKQACPVKKFYQEGAPGEPIALVGSTDYIEVAINGGNAAQALGLKIGDVVEVR